MYCKLGKWGSVVDCLLSMFEALGLRASIRKREREEGGEEAKEGENEGGKVRGWYVACLGMWESYCKYPNPIKESLCSYENGTTLIES